MCICDGPTESVECTWVNIWCMLDSIWSQNYRNTLLLHKAGQLQRSSKDTVCISNGGSGIDRLERYQFVKAGSISGSWLHNVLREKRRLP